MLKVFWLLIEESIGVAVAVGEGLVLMANDVLDGYRLIFRDRAQGNVVGNREGIYDRKRNPWRRNKRAERVRAARRFKAMIPQPYVKGNSYQQPRVQIALDNWQDVPVVPILACVNS